MFPMLLALLLAGAQLSAQARQFRSEFTLDELTGADSSYQPLSNLIGAGSSPQYHSAHHLQQPAQQVLYKSLMSNAAANQQRPVAASSNRILEPKLCHPTKPFLCPSDDDQGGECIPIQYLCDGSPDCPPLAGSPGLGYDEDPLLCTAAKRPPVEDTANFLRTLLANHGQQYIEKLFGPRLRANLEQVGGAERVAIALSVSKTIEDFGKALNLMRSDIEHLRQVLVAVQTADGPMLKELGINRNSELGDMKSFLVGKLIATGFLD